MYLGIELINLFSNDLSRNGASIFVWVIKWRIVFTFDLVETILFNVF